MSPPCHRPGRPAASTALVRVCVQAGRAILEARLARSWTIRRLATEACLSAAAVYAVEAGRPASVETYVRLAVALGLQPAISFEDRRRRSARVRDEDPVHAAMTETIAARMHGRGFPVATDEPYQHFQFAGRADLVAWDPEAAALLHCEQRTRLPNIQDTAGTFNAKRAYLADALAARLGIRRGFRSVTHVIVLLWSSEVLHTLRLRPETFRALAPDGAVPFEEWWSGSPSAGLHTGLVVFDPVPGGRSDRRRWIDLEQALTVRPRYNGYADAVRALRDAGRA